MIILSEIVRYDFQFWRLARSEVNPGNLVWSYSIHKPELFLFLFQEMKIWNQVYRYIYSTALGRKKEKEGEERERKRNTNNTVQGIIFKIPSRENICSLGVGTLKILESPPRYIHRVRCGPG